MTDEQTNQGSRAALRVLSAATGGNWVPVLPAPRR